MSTSLVIWLLIGSFATEKDSLWVTNFTNYTGGDLPKVEEGKFIKGFHDSLIVKLSPFFKVVDRNKMEDAFEEATLNDDELIREGSGPSLGNFTGAKYKLVGSITAYDEERLRVRAYGESLTKIVTTMVLTFQLVNIETSEIEFGDEIEVTHTVRIVPGKSLEQTGLLRKLSRKCADKVRDKIQTYLNATP